VIDIPLKLAEAYVEIAADSTKFKRELDKVQRELQRKSQQMQSNMRVAGAAMAGIGAAVTAGFAKAVVTFGQFEQVMANVGAVSNATADEMKKLTEFAKKMGETTIFTARESGKAMYFLASAGFSAEQQMASTNAVMKLAAATQSDLSETARLTVSSLKAFKLEAGEADRVVNVFAAAIGGSQATLEKLSVGIPIMSTKFDEMGYSVETATAALSVLIDRGLGASRSATGLRMSMNRLIRPTSKARKAIADMGLTVEELNPKTNELVDIVRKLENANMTAAQGIDIFGQRSEGMTILVSNGADALAEMEAKITGTTRAADMASRQLDTLAGKFKLLISAGEGLQITLAEQLAPALENMTESMTKTVSELNEWIKAYPIMSGLLIRFTAVLGGLVGAGGVLLLLAPAIVAAKVAFVGLAAAIPPVLTVLVAVGSSFWAVHKIIKSLTDDVDHVKVKMTEFEKRGQQFSGVFKDIHEALADFGGDKASATFADLGIDVGKLNKEINKGSRGIWAWGKAVKVQIRETATVSSVLTALNTNIYQGSRALKDYTGGLGDSADAVGALAENLKNLGKYLREVAEGAGDMIKKLGEIQDIKFPSFGEISTQQGRVEFSRQLRARTLPGTRDIRDEGDRPSAFDPSLTPAMPPPDATRKAWEIYWQEKRERYEKDQAALAKYNQAVEDEWNKQTEIVKNALDKIFDAEKDAVKKAKKLWDEKVKIVRDAMDKIFDAQEKDREKEDKAIEKSLEERNKFITDFVGAFQPAFQDLFADLIDPRVKADWKSFWSDLADIAIDELSRIVVSEAFRALKALITGQEYSVAGQRIFGGAEVASAAAGTGTAAAGTGGGGYDWGSTLSGAGVGYTATSLTTGGQGDLSEQIGAGIGALGGAALGSLLLPGVGTYIGGYLGGMLGKYVGGQFAEGSIVTKPTLALVGERGPEEIRPLGRASMAGGNTYNVSFPHADVRTVTREEMEYLYETKLADAEMSARAKGWVA